MRDPKEYKDAGRNDPTTPQQLEEHPYDFVELPSRPAALPAPSHESLRGDRLHGVIHLRYRTETPLHVGSGSFDTSEDHGFSGRPTPIRGLVRRRGAPVLPGSSWKGVVRSRFEAFTKSRLCLANTRSNAQAWKLPEVLREASGVREEETQRKKVRVEIQDPRVRELKSQGMIRSTEDLHRLSPADALFGGMGYRGRVRPMEGEIEGTPATDLLSVPPLEGPQMHRLAKPGKIITGHGRTPKPLHISQVEGRKFYYDGPLESKNQHGAWEPIDQVPAGSTLHITVHFTNLDHAELGALLLAAGYGDDVGIVRFGGYKSAGLGKVTLVQAEVHTHPPTTHRWRRPAADPLDLASLVSAARSAPWFDAEALRQLNEVTRRQRPGLGGVQ